MWIGVMGRVAGVIFMFDVVMRDSHEVVDGEGGRTSKGVFTERKRVVGC